MSVYRITPHPRGYAVQLKAWCFWLTMHLYQNKYDAEAAVTRLCEHDEYYEAVNGRAVRFNP